MQRSAVLSEDGLYRYELWRVWDLTKPTCALIGLNPSTADGSTEDPTSTRTIDFAKRWGFGSLCMLNLFAFRATEPKDMRRAADPVGPRNDAALQAVCSVAGIVVAAWGTNGTHRGRDEEVKRLIPNLHYLRLTKDGHPAHPLYLPSSLTPQLWRWNMPNADLF